ncbi:hypothetical protein QFZ64_000141 [Streptomyces sp. B3I8]|jgi:hypothetical protein|nr:hypothetical protein [Streptomyces sp. B3I8]
MGGSRGRSAALAVAVLAVASLMTASPAQAADTEDVTDVTRLDCAPIIRQGIWNSVFNRYAIVRNDCGRTITASVQVSYNADPDCATIAPGATHEFRWFQTSASGYKANYTYSC